MYQRYAIRLISCLALFCTSVMASTAAGSEVEVEPDMTEMMMMLAVQLGLILFAAKIGSMVFSKIKIPGVLGELCAGIVIGPFALGMFSLPGFPHGLFPLATIGPITPELYGFGAVAAIILLFDVGLETDLKLLLRYSFAGTLVGIGGVSVSFIMGAGITSMMSEWILGVHLTLFSPVCMFMGVISTATSVGITARVLSERKKLDSPEGVTILSAAVIDDVIGIVMLAVVLGIVAATASGSGSVHWGHIGMIGAKAVGVWLVSTVVGIVASRRISFLLKLFKDETAIAIMAFGLALVLAGLFEQVGLAMIIGAYVMGVSLSQSDISHLVREKIQPLYAFFVPIFFCITGMLINLKALMSGPVLIFGAAFTAVAILSKVLGCGIPAMFANFNLLGAMRIGTGMVPRGEVGLIMAGIGLNVKLMDNQGLPDKLFASVIVMIMICTILAPLGLLQLFNVDKKGTRKDVRSDDDEETVSFDMPSLHMAEFFIQKILEEFEGEGFFCYQLDHERRLHQLRKDESVIDFHLDDKVLTFTCNTADSVLVRGVMLEATASIEDALRNLKEPLDHKRFGQGMVQKKDMAARKFDLSQYMSAQHVKSELSATTKEEAIDELLQVLVDQGSVNDLKAAKDAIWERESKMTTGLEFGIAIPHGKTDTVDKLVCAVGISRRGIDFDSLDGDPARIIIITLSPLSKPAPHIQLMSTISQLLDEAGRMYLLDDRSAQEIYDFMTDSYAARKPGIMKRGGKAADSFQLIDYLHPSQMVAEIKGDTQEEVVNELLAVADKNGAVHDRAAAAAAVLKREQQMSTVMEEGLALPHGRTDSVDNLTCVIGIKPSGIDFDGDGTVETNIVILVLTPESEGKPYLQFVASILKTLDEAGRKELLEATDSQSMMDALT